MQLPHFKYSPNAYTLDLFDKEDGICSVCEQPRQLKYICSFYSVDEPEYICPWCIADGSTAKKYKGSFNDELGIEGMSPNPDDSPPSLSDEHIIAITSRTTSYFSWQQEAWLVHCNEPCAFIGYAGYEEVMPLLDELQDDLSQWSDDPEEMASFLTKDGSTVGYLFQCVQCGQHRLHVDCD